MDVAMISLTAEGARLAKKLLLELSEYGDSIEHFYGRSVGQWSEYQFGYRDALIYIGKTDTVVEALAPLLCNHQRRPSVVVLDDQGTFCIPLLAGDDGNADMLAKRIGSAIGCVAVIPKQGRRCHDFDLECWATSQNIKVHNPEQIKIITGKLSAGVPVKLLSLVEISGKTPEHLYYTSAPTEADIFFTVYDFSASSPDALILVPPVLVLGIGCRKGTSLEQIEHVVFDVFERSHIHFSAVSKVCSIDLKKNEPGLLAFCKKYDLAFETFSAKELSAVKGVFKRVSTVSRTVGIDNVSERSVMLATGQKSTVLIPSTAENGITLAAAANTDLIEHYHFP